MQKTLGNQPLSADNERDGIGAETPTSPLTTTPAEKDSGDMADPHSTPGRAPAFQFYAKDFLTDSNVIVMSLAERGAYITLICSCWLEGTLPSDVNRLARLCGCPLSAFRKIWPALAPCFRRRGTDRLVHPRLERERQKQAEYKQRQSDASRKRWDKPQASRGNATALPKPSSTSSSSSSSSDFSQKKDQIAERAGIFARETYPTLYAKHRKGARYVSKPHLDFMEAVELCRVWPDDRLEKIATVFLTTDHHFAENGSRTMAQFRAMASWCDSKLVEAGIA